MAVVKACQQLREKIIEVGANRLHVAKELAEFDGEKVFCDDKSITIFDLAVDFTVGIDKVQLNGFASHGSPVSPPPYIAGFVETEIDKETGKVEIIDYVAVVDCGTVINRGLATIQTEGGIVQGIGLALFEEVRYLENGQMDSNSFMQYKIPARSDVGTVRVDFVETYEPTGPFGAKSIGEVVINTPAPAIQDAIYNGVGVRVNSLPMNPEKIFMGE